MHAKTTTTHLKVFFSLKCSNNDEIIDVKMYFRKSEGMSDTNPHLIGVH
jgi:hypothetical protein